MERCPRCKNGLVLSSVQLHSRKRYGRYSVWHTLVLSAFTTVDFGADSLGQEQFFSVKQDTMAQTSWTVISISLLSSKVFLFLCDLPADFQPSLCVSLCDSHA